MNIRELDGKKVCILGFGREGKATLAALEEYAPQAQITIAEKNDLKINNSKIHTVTGENHLSDLAQYDVLIKSPGIPPCPELDAVSDKLTNSTQIFLDTVKDAGSIVIGITGSKGKSTVTSLIYENIESSR